MPKKNRNFIYTFFILIALLIMAGVSVFVFFEFFDREKGVYYSDFGIHLPADYQIHGIDVSRYQKKISWDRVAEMNVNSVKLGFAFMKATQGNGLVDSRFERNWYHAKRVGMVRGAYHYFNVHESGRSQAHNYMQLVKLSAGDLPPVVDIEQVGGVPIADIRNNLKTWLEAVEHHYRVKPIIYTYADFYEDYLLGYFDEYPLWIAHYHSGKNPRTSRNWHFWQHNEDGRVNGIDAAVDFNVFNGDTASFNKLLMQ